MAKRISVAVGDSETIFAGLALRVTALAPVPTVIGNAGAKVVVAVFAVVGAVVADVLLSSPQAAPKRHSMTAVAMDMNRLICWSPFARGTIERLRPREAGSRAISSSSRAVLRCATGSWRPGSVGARPTPQLRDSAGFSPDFAALEAGEG